jgi:hypothetical protein
MIIKPIFFVPVAEKASGPPARLWPTSAMPIQLAALSHPVLIAGFSLGFSLGFRVQQAALGHPVLIAGFSLGFSLGFRVQLAALSHPVLIAGFSLGFSLGFSVDTWASLSLFLSLCKKYIMCM